MVLLESICKWPVIPVIPMSKHLFCTRVIKLYIAAALMLLLLLPFFLRREVMSCWCLETPGRRALMLLAATLSILTGKLINLYSC